MVNHELLEGTQLRGAGNLKDTDKVGGGDPERENLKRRWREGGETMTEGLTPGLEEEPWQPTYLRKSGE